MTTATRTTVSLDNDVLRLLRERADSTGGTIRRVLNDAIRQGLAGGEMTYTLPPQWPTYTMGEAAVALTKAMALSEEPGDLSHSLHSARSAIVQADVRPKT